MDNYYDSEVANQYYEAAEDANENFQKMKEFNAFAGYVQRHNSICEFWCGEWGKIWAFLDLDKELSLNWIDISQYWIDKAKQKYENINFTIWNIAKTWFNNEFLDIAMSFFVFEHLQNPLIVFQEMFRVTKKGGHIFLWFPNYWSPLFPSPPSLYWKTVISKICLILKRIFRKKDIYQNVTPITHVDFQPDFDTTAEIYMWKFVQHIKESYDISIVEESSKWENIENGNFLFKLYYPFKIFKRTIFKYWWPQCFLIIKKN